MASRDAGGEGQGSEPEPNVLFAPDFAENALKLMQLPDDVEGALQQGDWCVRLLPAGFRCRSSGQRGLYYVDLAGGWGRKACVDTGRAR